MKIIKSIGAVIAGMLAGALLSITTDYMLNSIGLMDMDRFKDAPFSVVLLIIVYRFLFNASGSYITSLLAPSKPLLHSMVLGVTGLLLSITGFYIMADKATVFYNLSITLLALPSAWLGGKLYTIRNKN